MRASFFSAAVLAALAVTSWSPGDAQAQVYVYPSFNSSPYVYPAGYSYPSYAYNYAYSYPGYRTYSYGWSNPYSTWAWSGYRNYPYSSGYGGYWGGSRYGWGGYRGYRRW